MAFVVLMLFAVTVLAAVGFAVVSSEYELAEYAAEGSEALVVARAGLQRFLAEELGPVSASASYALGGGVAVVTSRRVVEGDDVTRLYVLRSEATVLDPRRPTMPARRVVGAYAIHRGRPLRHHSAVMIGADTIDVSGAGRITGLNQNRPGDCGGGVGRPIGGAVARLSISEERGSQIQGSPGTETWPAGWAAIADSIGVRWDVLTDPNLPFEFENRLPDFASIPQDSFPLIRYSGWVEADWSGRGTLIVDGVFDPTPTFAWQGIVLAEHVDDRLDGRIEGVLIAGVQGPNMYPKVDFQAEVLYHACYADAANESLAELELIPGTIRELY